MTLQDDEVYVIVWVGGYGAPSYTSKRTLDEARVTALEWETQINEDQGEWVDVLRLNLHTMAMTLLSEKEIKGEQ